MCKNYYVLLYVYNMAARADNAYLYIIHACSDGGGVKLSLNLSAPFPNSRRWRRPASTNILHYI